MDDFLFASNNEWDIPTLKEDLQLDLVAMPLESWGAVSRGAFMPGTFNFYVEDYRFSALWKHPDELFNTQCYGVIEPNYSTSDVLPLALGIGLIYRKRWLARYWQTRGVKVAVDMWVSRKYFEHNLIGVPKGWRSYATRGNVVVDFVRDAYNLACKHARTDDIIFIVYGGTKEMREFCASYGILWFPDTANVRNGAAKEYGAI